MTLIEILYLSSKIFLFLGIILAMIRFFKGPDPLNQILSLDMMAITGQGLLAIFFMEFSDKILIDVLIIWAILPFVATASISILIYKRAIR